MSSAELSAAGYGKSAVLSRGLGVSSGTVADERMSASSSRHARQSLFAPWLARVNARDSLPSGGGWRAAEDCAGQWLQIDLMREYKLSSLKTQGLADGSSWVTRFKLYHSLDGEKFDLYPREFPGNRDADSPAHNDLHRATLARYVRIEPTEWHHHIGMRVEVLGFSPECAPAEEDRILGVPCAKAPSAVLQAFGDLGGDANVLVPAQQNVYTKGFPLGIEAGTIPDAAFSASSEYVPAEFFAHSDDLPQCRELHAALRAREGGAPAATLALISGEPVAVIRLGDRSLPRFMAADDSESPAAASPAAASPAAASPAVASPAAASPAAEPSKEPAAESPAAPPAESPAAAAPAAASDRDAAVIAALAAALSSSQASSAALTYAGAGEDSSRASDPDCGIKTSYAAHFARYNLPRQPYKAAGWEPAIDAAGEYLQVDLGSLQEVDAVVLQGRARSQKWVTSFQLAFSSNGQQWETVSTPFTGCSDADTPIKTVLARPLLTRFLRFIAKDWSRVPGGGIGMRVEALGPGAGAGCMLRCFASKLSLGVGGEADTLDARIAATNGVPALPALLEVDMSAARAGAGATSAVAALADLAVAAGSPAARLVQCCGCGCCTKAGCTPAALRAGRRTGNVEKFIGKAAAMTQDTVTVAAGSNDKLATAPAAFGGAPRMAAAPAPEDAAAAFSSVGGQARNVAPQ